MSDKRNVPDVNGVQYQRVDDSDVNRAIERINKIHWIAKKTGVSFDIAAFFYCQRATDRVPYPER